MQYNSIYVYGIIEGKINGDLNIKGIGDREDEVYSIPFKDVSAIVSNTPFEEYDPSEENILNHEKVIQSILNRDLTIAPMRFCTILGSRNDILKLLHSAYFEKKE
jgi:hypothetical protein